jgi:hypothetical protein
LVFSVMLRCISLLFYFSPDVTPFSFAHVYIDTDAIIKCTL